MCNLIFCCSSWRTLPTNAQNGSQGDDPNVSRRSRTDPRWHNPSEFCQEPPESSGRWECAVIHSSVHENSRCQQTTADLYHVLPTKQHQPKSSVLLLQLLQPHRRPKLLQVQFHRQRGRIPEDALKVEQIENIVKLLFIVICSFSFSN